ncbi:MAG: hypothetical protein RLZZ399_1858 [Verrucomicrobiota bacterium]
MNRPPNHSIQNQGPARGFTLIELMLVIGVMLILLGIVAPSMTGVLKGKKIEQALTTTAATLEAARMEALSQNAYVWVGFLNVPPLQSPSKQDELWIMNFRVKPESNRPPSEISTANGYPVSALQRTEGVSLISGEKLPKAIREGFLDPLAPAPLDLNAEGDARGLFSWKMANRSEAFTFSKLICFTPRGEAIVDYGESTLPPPQPLISICLAQTLNGKVPLDTKDGALLLVSGFNGRVSPKRLGSKVTSATTP